MYSVFHADWDRDSLNNDIPSPCFVLITENVYVVLTVF